MRLLNKKIFEVIVYNAQEAEIATRHGATQLELIPSLDLGGVSPSRKLVDSVVSNSEIPVHVMLRPQKESFCYSKEEKLWMLKELDYLLTTNTKGIVFGALNADYTIDFNFLEEISKNRGSLKLIFHRAIDVSNDCFKNYLLLQDSGLVDYVLSSGGFKTAVEGADTLSKMQKVKQNLPILMGSGIDVENIQNLIQKTKITDIHLGTGVRTNGLLNDLLIQQIKNQLLQLNI